MFAVVNVLSTFSLITVRAVIKTQKIKKESVTGQFAFS